MIAALATLAFLAAAWLAIVAFAKTLDENHSRIVAAFGGASLEEPFSAAAIRVSRRYPAQRMTARPALRAAA